MPQVAQFMTSAVVTVGPDATLAEALTYMASQHVSGLGVVDHQLRLVGVISQSDILEAEAEAGDRSAVARMLEDTRVSELMSAPAMTIAPDSELRQAAQTMEYADVHRLFVVRDGKLAGVVSRSDVSRALAIGRL